MPTISVQEARALGYPAHGVQTILISELFKLKSDRIPRTREWKLSKAKKWVAEHGFQSYFLRQTDSFNRFMQLNPVIGNKYYTEVLPNGIELVIYRNRFL